MKWNLEISEKRKRQSFFDWAYNGQDGTADHTGIVERVENGIVYTVEGNTSDSCAERHYAVGHSEILGYGMPAY